MKTLKFLIFAILFTSLVTVQEASAQDEIKVLKNKVKDKKNQISANEEFLISGISALKRVNSNLENFKKDKKATKKEVKRKEKIVANVQTRLTNLKNLINDRKGELVALEKKLARKQKRATPKEVKTVQETETESAAPLTDAKSELALRKQKLENARKKLEDERKAKEIAYLNQQEELRLEADKLAQLDNQIKAEEESIINENKTLISDYEDDISINEEILISGKKD
ncbi:hypothetical protein CXF68_13365 [Tenacibaculum sp. Bg11-29]|uniref:hypothetical protein n=1 Tax=Tenacibaculum sp. Bg11-29 TaxID=2058306 RepID=UPI000C33658D|nr:hypothetical protein [Tenacibaculum sp. Bg11-29]PKH51609.1 hypothetical protein CXF68_13365 [Tenacibaculum sp. Bg11-29]